MNVILIGMPGSGKSTLGVQLAKELAMDFIDTDLLIQQQENCRLQDILDNQGYLALRQIEEDLLLSLNYQNSIISTGGSAVYSEKAMKRFKSMGVVVFLDVGLPELQKRVNNEGQRGIARPASQSFTDVFNERTPLYKKYADITFDNNKSRDISELCDIIGRQNKL